MSFQLAVSAEMTFLDLDVVERVRTIHDLGMAVEIWNWTNHDVDALVATGATFTSMTGYVEGDLVTPEGSAELLRTARLSLEVAERLDSPALNLHGTGLDGQGLPVLPLPAPTGAEWLAARQTLAAIAELGREAGRVFTLENLNTAVDHPGTPFARAADTRALVASVDSPHLKMNLDLYHAQIGEGNLTDLVRESLPWVGEIQVADVPGRCEPGTGEVAWPHVARVLDEAGYTGVVGLEAWASGDSVEAVEAFRKAFTV
ncbi:TIM barrel protein [Solicola sp. PLA-1-18]|uniref:TIM barrel protein n=1 Tax=Solicola sp. PLA-1-18 TaxID=3380532 RepID=UPI003B7DC80F